MTSTTPLRGRQSSTSFGFWARSIWLARQRGWIVERDSLFDRFFAGYRKGLREPEFQPRRPVVVDRLRVGMQRSRPEFLN
jgi:hypothetical protein